MNKFKKLFSILMLLLAVGVVASCDSTKKPAAIVDFTSQRVAIKATVTLVDPDEILVDGAAYMTIYEADDEDETVITTKSLTTTTTSEQEVKFVDLDVDTSYVITLYFTYNKKKHVYSEDTITTTNSGTEDDPIIISTYDELVAASSDEEAYYALNNDIDCEGEVLSPLFSNSLVFTGGFDGRNHKLMNVTMGSSDSPVSLSYQGIFGYSKAEIKNLTIENATYYSKRASDCYVGGIAGYNAGSITNVKMTNVTIIATSTGTGRQYIGGFVGKNADNGNINNCSIENISITLAAKNLCSVGGFIGENVAPTSFENNQVVENSHVTEGTIAVTQANTGTTTEIIECIVGGFVGRNLRVISDCYASVDVTATVSKKSTEADTYSASIGGFAGEIGTSDISSISQCAARSVISLTSGDLFVANVGGLVGYVGQWGTVRNSIAITKGSSIDVELNKDLAYNVSPIIGQILTATKNINNTVSASYIANVKVNDTTADPITSETLTYTSDAVCTNFEEFTTEVKAFIDATK